MTAHCTLCPVECGADRTTECGACGASAELSSIEITTPPTKTEYVAGEKFDPTGMVVTAKYDDETEKTLTAEDWTYDLTGELKTSDRNVTVSYTENEVTKTVRQRITVTNDVVEAAIKTHATKTEYLPGEVFDPTGMVITVTAVSAAMVPMSFDFVSGSLLMSAAIKRINSCMGCTSE